MTYNSYESLVMTSAQELIEVASGRKKSALGFWEELPENILSVNLFPIPGRYYRTAIALTQEDLDEVTLAYYSPVSPESDRRLGKILSYDDISIDWYISTMNYTDIPNPDEKERILLKFKSFIEKNGLVQFKEIIEAAISGDKLVLSTFLKEFF